MTDIFPGAKLMQLVEWGFPMGSLRPSPSKDKAWSVVHITANLSTAENEALWRQRDTGLQNSATFFVNRDGSVVQCLGDPLRMDPWANGDVNTPDVSNPRIAQMVKDGVNANERTLVAIENVGNEIPWGSVPGGHPITPEQEETDAQIIAYYHPKAGVPISRETVIGHYQLNSVSRPNCPGRNKALIDRIVARAQVLAGDDVNLPLRFQPVEWNVKSGVPFWTGGPGTGEQKFFAADATYDSTVRSQDGSWVLLRIDNEEVWVKRSDLAPTVPGGDPAYAAAVRKVIEEGPSAIIGDPTCPPKLEVALQTIADQKTTISEQAARISAAKTALG